MRQLLMALGLLALGVTSCGQPNAQGTRAAPTPATVSLWPKDSGGTVTLAKDDTLLLHLDRGTSSHASWRLALYPKKSLSPVASRDGFAFKAVRVGTGQLVALDVSRTGGACGPGKLEIKRPRQCPVRASLESDGLIPRPGLFMINVVVS
jgi:hypothetical protein